MSSLFGGGSSDSGPSEGVSGGGYSKEQQQSALMAIAQQQQQMQQMMLKVNEAAFKLCTSKSTSAELSKKEKQCIRNTVDSYVEARTLAMQQGGGGSQGF